MPHLQVVSVGKRKSWAFVLLVCTALWSLCLTPVRGQMTDQTQAPNTANEGIHKSLSDEVGAGRGDVNTPGSSLYLIARDPFRAIRRGRQLFQRKFTRAQGQGPLTGDGKGDLNTTAALGAGLTDSCAACHARPRGSAGFGGDVVTRPDSRSVPHLFGLGLKEMLGDEMTADLRAIRDQALAQAQAQKQDVTQPLQTKGVEFGSITAHADGTLETNGVQGVDPDLRVRPFFAHGGKLSIREFLVGALNDEMGLQAPDTDLATAASGGKVTTPSGMVLDGSQDRLTPPPTADPNADPDGDGVTNEVPLALVDYLEFYLLNYFPPAHYEPTPRTELGRKVFTRVGCAVCHVPDLPIDHDRRVAQVETVFDPNRGNFNGLFATVTSLTTQTNDSSAPPLQSPRLQPFLVKDFFSDLKRHDLGPNFYERNFDGSLQREFMTRPLWGVGTVSPHGHDGRSINLKEVILRHGGEAQSQATAFAGLPAEQQSALLEFLRSLVLFPPDDTASNLDPGDPNAPSFPQYGHGSIKLSALFNDPSDPE